MTREIKISQVPEKNTYNRELKKKQNARILNAATGVFVTALGAKGVYDGLKKGDPLESKLSAVNIAIGLENLAVGVFGPDKVFGWQERKLHKVKKIFLRKPKT